MCQGLMRHDWGWNNCLNLFTFGNNVTTSNKELWVGGSKSVWWVINLWLFLFPPCHVCSSTALPTHFPSTCMLTQHISMVTSKRLQCNGLPGHFLHKATTRLVFVCVRILLAWIMFACFPGGLNHVCLLSSPPPLSPDWCSSLFVFTFPVSPLVVVIAIYSACIPRS